MLYNSYASNAVEIITEHTVESRFVKSDAIRFSQHGTFDSPSLEKVQGFPRNYNSLFSRNL